jgi:hypothetical protein
LTKINENNQKYIILISKDRFFIRKIFAGKIFAEENICRGKNSEE